ncbi:MAG: serine/threonine-protein kinase [Acidobacteria bacterium]|nr:serine/threonine-protein kinase [Acidobacteriota bacterium]
MNHDRWTEIETLYNSARLMESAEREAFLATACAGDDVLRQEVLSLLASGDSTDSFLDESALSLGLAILDGDGQESLVGAVIGHYNIVRVLGRGGMGEVYLAYDVHLRRNVALKLLPNGVVSDTERIRRFEQEARLASAISHPHIAHIYEIGEALGRRFIAMEYVSGKTLRDTLRRGALDMTKALGIAAQATAALAAAHNAGVVHRDIKPENLMLRTDGYIKVLDFGLAKSAHNQSEVFCSYTDERMLMGTVAYMSPEQLSGREVDARTDVWSLGVTLYEMIAGYRPFEATERGDLISAILNLNPTPLSADAGTPEGLHRVLTRTLSKNPLDRYSRAQDLYEDLERLLNTSGQRHRTLLPTNVGETSDGTHANITEKIGTLFLRTAWANIAQRTLHTGLLEGVKQHQLKFVAITLLLAASITGLLLRWNRPTEENIKFVKLSSSNRVIEATISPNGTHVVIIIEDEGRQGILLRDIATAKEEQIVELSDSHYRSLRFSPNGKYVFYLKQEEQQSTLFQVYTVGGTPRKVLENVHSPVTFSPDGSKMAFIRKQVDGTALIIANADGSEERERATLLGNTHFSVSRGLNSNPAWSPDGNVIACPTSSQESPFHMDVAAVRVADGSLRKINLRPWYLIGQIAWLPDGSGLVMNAGESGPGSTMQLWQLTVPEGEGRLLTPDASFYQNVSVTSDATTLLTNQTHQVSHIWLIGVQDTNRIERIPSSQDKGIGGIAWGPDGRLVYASEESGNLDLWTMTERGDDLKRLTFHESPDATPSVSGDGRRIAYTSDRTGESHVWLMNADGGHQEQLTFGKYEDEPQISPDGKWLVYHSEESLRHSIWRVPIEGGEPLRLTDKQAKHPVISPNGRLLACFIRELHAGANWQLSVMTYPAGHVVKTFDVPQSVAEQWHGVRWTNDSRSLTYVVKHGGVSNVWSQSIIAGPPKKVTEFQEGEIQAFAWSRDDKKLACVRTTNLSDILLIHNFR